MNLDSSGPGPNPDEYCASGTITNTKLAPEGEYNYLVGTWDQQTGIYLYDEFIIEVNDTELTGNLIWATSAKSIDHNWWGFGQSITTLSDNSTVSAGIYRGTAIFGEGGPNETTLISINETPDFFFARYNPDGTFAWAKSAGGGSDEAYSAVTALSDNSIAVTGYFKGTVIFGEGEPEETILISQGNNDIFIARYNPDGTLAWAKSAGGPGYCNAPGITVLPDNSTVITGYINGTITFGQGEPGETILDCVGSIIARYNPDGTLAWAKLVTADGSTARSHAISARADNSTVITGRFGGTVIFGSGQPNETTLTSAGSSDIFIACYNPDGSFAWAKSAGGSYEDKGLGITTLSDNSTVITGYFYFIATFGKGEPNETVLEGTPHCAVFIARYNSDGSFLWAENAWISGNFMNQSITALADDSIIITGDFSEFMYFAPGDPGDPDTEIILSNGGLDIYIARYASDGTFEWVKQAGGVAYDNAYAITSLSDDSTVITGCFQNTATFGLDEPGETILTAAGWKDIFIANYEP